MSTIDLDQCTDGGRVHNLAGKDWGQRVRNQLNIDDMDLNDEIVNVKIPSHVYAVSPSFFLGLFSRSLDTLGGREGFLRKYNFSVSEAVREQVLDGILDWEYRSKVIENPHTFLGIKIRK